MLRRKYATRITALLAVLLIGLPSVGFSQQAKPVPKCKSAYTSCVKGKELNDATGKLACAEQYKQCLKSAEQAGSNRVPWSAQAGGNKAPQ